MPFMRLKFLMLIRLFLWHLRATPIFLFTFTVSCRYWNHHSLCVCIDDNNSWSIELDSTCKIFLHYVSDHKWMLYIQYYKLMICYSHSSCKVPVHQHLPCCMDVSYDGTAWKVVLSLACRDVCNVVLVDNNVPWSFMRMPLYCADLKFSQCISLLDVCWSAGFRS